jgi:hypothetical protein
MMGGTISDGKECKQDLPGAAAPVEEEIAMLTSVRQGLDGQAGGRFADLPSAALLQRAVSRPPDRVGLTILKMAIQSKSASVPVLDWLKSDFFLAGLIFSPTVSFVCHDVSVDVLMSAECVL